MAAAHMVVVASQMENCQATCQLCPEGCHDFYFAKCKAHKAEGWCETYPAYMGRYCRNSCSMCSDPIPLNGTLPAVNGTSNELSSGSASPPPNNSSSNTSTTCQASVQGAI
jgi:hypothetical protein